MRAYIGLGIFVAVIAFIATVVTLDCYNLMVCK